MNDDLLLSGFHATMHHFFPKFVGDLSRLPDPRNPDFITYPLPVLLLEGVFLFLLKLESRRDIAFQLGQGAFVQNLWQWAGREKAEWGKLGNEIGRIPHGDTLDYLLSRMDPASLGGVRTRMVGRLIRMRALEGDRLLSAYYRIAIDGTWNVSFERRHCDWCLVREHVDRETGETTSLYYHPVLEAKLVTSNGLALSVATEFIENEGAADKQDCELRAFYRLAEKLKADFPQLPLCLIFDGLYAAGSVFDLCEKNRWKYLITFKEGSMPSVYREFEDLKKLSPENRQHQAGEDGREADYAWVTDIDYEGRRLNVLEMAEPFEDKRRRFVWLTNLGLEAACVPEIARKGGRLRWKIENEGFNMQKNGGYGLEHAFSRNPIAIKNFYLLLQMAHTIGQLMEKGSLLRQTIAKVFGSLRNFSTALREALTRCAFHFDPAFFTRRIQIRFATDSG